jgi:hypothetical protein
MIDMDALVRVVTGMLGCLVHWIEDGEHSRLIQQSTSLFSHGKLPSNEKESSVVTFNNQTKIMIYFSTKLNPDGFEFLLTSLL